MWGFFARDLGTPDAPAPWLAQPVPLASRVPALAHYVLHCFHNTVRFVDDFTSGPNPLLPFLWYDTQSILGGLVSGIYPGPQVLTLDRVPGDPCAYPTLDIRVVSSVVSGGFVQSRTVLYDKRREACYADIPLVQYSWGQKFEQPKGVGQLR